MTAREMRYEAEIIYESIASQDAPGYTDREWSVLLTQAQENIILDICKSGLDENELNRRKISKLLKYKSFIPELITDIGFPNAYGPETTITQTTLSGTATHISVTLNSSDVIYTNGVGVPATGEVLLEGQKLRIAGVIYEVGEDGTEDGFTLSVNYEGATDEIAIGTNAMTEAGKLTYTYGFPEDYYYRASGRCSTEDPFASNIKLIPISRSVYDANHDNPFKNPSLSEGFWLIDDDGRHIIITDGNEVEGYHLEYVSKPKPIIIETLDPEDAIEGNYLARDCVLDPIIHREVVQEAAKLGYAYLKDQLGYQIQSVEQQQNVVK